jgi:hypothetical protein
MDGAMSPKTAFLTTRALTPGTPEWAQSAPGFLSQAVRVVLRELECIPRLAHELESHRIWEILPSGAATWDDFCVGVLQVDPRVLDALVKLARTALPSSALTASVEDEAGRTPVDRPDPANDDGAISLEDAEVLAFDFTSLVDLGPSIISPPKPSPSPSEMSGRVLVDRALVEEWIVLAAQRVWRGAATQAAPIDRERALELLARIREVAASAGLDLDHVALEEDGRLVDIPPEDDDGETSPGWDLATGEREIRDLIARDARRPAKAKRARSSAARSRR